MVSPTYISATVADQKIGVHRDPLTKIKNRGPNISNPRLLRGSPLRSASQSPLYPSELLCICIVRAYTDSYVDSQNSLFCLLTCNNDHKLLYMPILWYVVISSNSMLKSFEVHNSCLKPQKPGSKISRNCCLTSSHVQSMYSLLHRLYCTQHGRNQHNKVCVKDKTCQSIGKRHC